MKENEGSLTREELVTEIHEEETKLGTAREWTSLQIQRLEKIRDLRRKLPKDTNVPARGQLGGLFHLPNTKEGQKDFDLQSQEERV